MIHGVTVGSGPAQVVFLHGLFGQGKNFTRIATSLAGVATCHLLDLPNHGASSWTVGFTLDGQSEHIARWLRENFEGPVALVGHSLGGKLAMRLALAHPGLVDRLLVADISPVPSDGPTGFAPLVAAMRSLDLEHLASRTEASSCRTCADSAGTGRGRPTWICLVIPSGSSAAGRGWTRSTTVPSGGWRGGNPPTYYRSTPSRCVGCSPGSSR